MAMLDNQRVNKGHMKMGCEWDNMLLKVLICFNMIFDRDNEIIDGIMGILKGILYTITRGSVMGKRINHRMAMGYPMLLHDEYE